jgi:hypothetical protein
MTDQPGSESTVESTSKRATRPRKKAAAPAATAARIELPPVVNPAQPDEAQEGGQRIEATTVRMTRSGVAEVEAETITIRQGGIGAASAEDISIEYGGIGQAQADDIAVRMGGIGIARGERVSVELGAIGLAVGGDVSIVQGAVRAVVARDVQMKQTLASTVMAGSVTMDRQSGAFIVIARRVDGTVRAVLDWRGALALGAAMGVAIALLGRRTKS